MFTEDSNIVIEAIKNNNLEVDDLFLKDIGDFKKAFEEDSLDEYLDENPTFTCDLEILYQTACKEMRRINHEYDKRERMRRRRSQNSNQVNRITSTEDLLDLINPYKNHNIMSFKHAMHEAQKIEKFIYEEQSKKNNVQNPPVSIVESAKKTCVELKLRNTENNIIKAPEEENYYNIRQNLNKKQTEEKFIIDSESFYKNSDLTVPENEKQEFKFLEIMNLSLCSYEKKVDDKGSLNRIEKETKRMLENPDRRKKRIFTLINTGLLESSFSNQIKVNNPNRSTLENEFVSYDDLKNPQNEKENQERPKFYCLIENCGRFYSTKGALDVHIKKHHLKHKYECQFCSKSFSAFNCCKDHIKKLHPNEKNVKLTMIENN